MGGQARQGEGSLLSQGYFLFGRAAVLWIRNGHVARSFLVAPRPSSVYAQLRCAGPRLASFYLALGNIHLKSSVFPQGVLYTLVCSFTSASPPGPEAAHECAAVACGRA